MMKWETQMRNRDRERKGEREREREKEKEGKNNRKLQYFGIRSTQTKRNHMNQNHDN